MVTDIDNRYADTDTCDGLVPTNYVMYYVLSVKKW